MQRWIKADFHLHTYHSDNRDRMTPQEYVTLGRRLGYDVLGFCDHHHNLTQTAWQTLQSEVADLADSPLLLTTGYEATFVTGHLCVLDKRLFDGESVADCRRQLWSPANTRILAHPDNNACAWLLPLPVGVQGVEVINGGQDLYAYRPTSPCNGLPTYMRYLLLNHPVAAVAQSDCHERALFGRVWTGLALPIDAPLTWVAVQDALNCGRSFASMGDLTLRVWTASGASLETRAAYLDTMPPREKTRLRAYRTAHEARASVDHRLPRPLAPRTSLHVGPAVGGPPSRHLRGPTPARHGRS